MSKRLLGAALALLLLLPTAFGQDKVALQVFGKPKGKIKIVSAAGRTFVDARKMAKAFKFQTSWFGQSGQLNIKGKSGYFATLRSGQNYATVNGNKESIGANARLESGALYAPVDFFGTGSVARAAGMAARYEGGKIIVDSFGSAPAIIAPAPQPEVDAAPPPPSVLDDGDIIEPLPTPQIAPAPQPILQPAADKKTRKLRVLIDAGHGGKDPGAVRRGGDREKDINLHVAKELSARLSKDKTFEAKMTREKDVFLPLGRRARMANDFKADIFISIHTNAAKRAGAHGFEIYFRSDKASSAEAAETAALENQALKYEEGSANSVSFADLLLRSLAVNENMNESSKIASHMRAAAGKNARATGIKILHDTCIKQANFYVLRGVQAPSVLVELGFLSNVNDRKRLSNKASRVAMAQSLYESIVSYAKAEGWK